MDLKKLIGEMTQARGLPGYEGDVAAIFCREMEKIGLKTDTDAIGNATAYMGKAGGPRIMATAHLDEIGLIVTEILDDGALRFTRMGGVDPRILPGSKVRVYTKEGKLTGVIGAKPPHLLTAAERKKNLEMKDMYIDMGMSAERIREIQKISQEPVSLETPIGEEEDSQLGDFIEDSQAVAPPEAASDSMLREQLEQVLDGLADRERKVIKLRFGLEDGHPRTLEEVGREFGVTRERIRQIESKTLAKLRHPSRSGKLKDYMEE